MLISQTRIGRYEVVSALGQGAMGAVYKAVDPLIERDVAIKTISLNLSKAERAEFEERFYREAKSAGRLNHANIVTIYDVGETDDIAYIAMEYVEGKSLREMLDSGVVLPVELIGKIVARIANALHYAHENHVVHRDIKPANIMITSKRDVKIMDFGIAQIPTGSRTQLGTVLGSPKYMAPEQVVGQPTDGRTDIFALGGVLYEMLTGTTPFNGDNLSALMYKVLNEDPAPPSTINPRVPPTYDRIIRRALAKRPEDRYQTAREFARDLKNPDAAPSRQAQHHLSARVRQAQAAESGSLPDEEPTTLLLQPRRAGAAVPAAGKETMLVRPKAARLGRKLRWLALPVVILGAYALVAHRPQPERGTELAAAPAPAPAPATAPPSSPQPPVVPTEPAVAPVPAPPVPPAPAVTAEVSPPAPAVPRATLMLAVSPWGEVYVDGKRVGVSPPLTTLQLEAGRHKVEIRNRGFASYRKTVNLESGRSLKIRHKFQ